MMEKELGDSIFETIKGHGGKDLLFDAAEFVLDSNLSEGIIKDIPFAGTVQKLFSCAISLQGYFFAKKIQKFLTKLSEVNQEQREKFVSEINENLELKEKTSDAVLLILDKLDDLEKCELFANAFSGYIQAQFDFTTFRRLSNAIEKCLVSDLQYLKNLAVSCYMENYIGDVLVGAGLVYICSAALIKPEGTKNMYQLTEFGVLFLDVVINNVPRSN
ncbi:hypothetical protein [Iodobacter fluviatilis]|uniref:Uncharacterized protein n=1 Tax=Iodobacter fluviatilis TaxID=537 RepID=A0A7G3G885_9NEIS|nr:hypothetical protein [Iodobacter fluviatilis]QBC43318.1 hypothetical protein C1H71_07035 [Iodobacter fluviatilis]